ncbi:MAG: tetratricopeptide repeat protein [Spirochaetes bacterium]|nr:tetratricopeptide repeat protein [Spirochaetota bacterium]
MNNKDQRLKNTKQLIIAISITGILLLILSLITVNIIKNNYIDSRLKLAKTLIEGKDYEETKKLLQEILLKYPNHLYSNLIYKNLIKNNYDLALKLIEEYLNKGKKENLKIAQEKEKSNTTNSNSNSSINQKNTKDKTSISNESSNTKSSENTSQNSSIAPKTSKNNESTKKTTAISSPSTQSSSSSSSVQNPSKNQQSQTQETKQTESTTTQQQPKIDPNKQKYDELIKKGKEELNKGNIGKAIEYFEDAKKYKNDDYEAYEQLALSYYKLNPNSSENQKKIIENANKATDIKKDSVLSYVLLGKIYYKNGLYDKSIDSFSKALSYDPNNIDAMEGMVLNYIALKDEEKAKNYIEKLYKADPKNFIANKYLGKMALDAKNYNQALAHIETAYKVNPDDKENIINYLKALYSLNKFNEVISLAQNSLKKEPKYVDEYLFLSLSYWKIGQGNNSISTFNEGLKSNNYYDETYKYKYFYNYGKVLADLKKFNEAEEMFKKSIEINNSYLLPYEELGSLYINNLKKYKEAIQVLEKAIQLGGVNYTNYFNLGTAYKEMGDMQKALENYASAINENKKITDVNQRSQNYAKVYSIIGNMILKDDPAKSYEYYKKALTYASPFIETYSGFCDAALKIDNFNDLNTLNDTVTKFEANVKTSISSDLDINREKANFYVKAGTLYFKLKVFDKAESMAKKAISLISKYASAYDLIIEALIAQKKYDEALKYIDTYLGFANEEKRKELLKKIEEINKNK